MIKNEERPLNRSSLSEITDNDKIFFTNLLQELKNKKEASEFLKPVDVKNIPDYLKIIGNKPMDLETMEIKLNNNKYSLLQDFLDDINQIWDNCRIYNREGSEIYIASEILEKYVNKEFSKHYTFKIDKTEKNYEQQYEKNVYEEESFTDPDFYEKNPSTIFGPFYNKENDSKENESKMIDLRENEEIKKNDKVPENIRFSFIYYKVKLYNKVIKLKKDSLRKFFEGIMDGTIKEISFLKKYIDRNQNTKFIKFHIERLNKKELINTLNYLDSSNLD